MSDELAGVVVDEDEVKVENPGSRKRSGMVETYPRTRYRTGFPFVVMEIVQNKVKPMVSVYAFRPGSADLKLLDSPSPGQVRIFPWTKPVDVSLDPSRQSAFQTMLRTLYANCNHEYWSDTVIDEYSNSREKTIYHNPDFCLDCHLYVVYDPRSTPYMGMPVPSATLQISQTFDSIKYEVSYVCKPASSQHYQGDSAIPDFSQRIRVYQVLRAIMRRLLQTKPHIQAFVLDSISRQASESYMKAGFEIDEEHDRHADMPTMTATKERVNVG
jgi:hypothetical protein